MVYSNSIFYVSNYFIIGAHFDSFHGILNDFEYNNQQGAYICAWHTELLLLHTGVWNLCTWHKVLVVKHWYLYLA